MIKKVESFTFGVKSLKKALKTLSLSPDAQVAYLANGGYGDCADELALEFDDAYQVLKGYFGKKLLTPQAESLIETINSRLNSISGPENLSSGERPHCGTGQNGRLFAIWLPVP